MDYDDAGLAYDQQLEEAALGSLLLKPNLFQSVLAETKLSVDTFYFQKNKEVFETCLKLFEKGVPPAETLVSSELNGTVPKGYVFQLTGSSPAAFNVHHYATRLVELQRWRTRLANSHELVGAAKERDIEKFARVKSSLDNDEIRTNSVKSAKESGQQFLEYMEQEELEAFALPYPVFNERMGGGLRRKQMTLVGGWSSHGKSVVVDQWAEHFAKAGHKTHLYINEMGEEDRIARSISRVTGISYQRLIQHKLNDNEKQRVKECVKDGCPYFDITECAGWSIHELAYDIKSRSYDVVIVDILHLFDYESEVELARISRLLNRTAKQSNCHILATVHLNEFRANDIVRPRPVLRDIRGSGMLKNDADNVIFIYRFQDAQTGDPTPDSVIYSSKIRNGQMSNVHLMFKEKTFKFEEE